MTKVVILAGGKGSRLQEMTGEVPKPMLLIDGLPMIQRIMDRFIFGGFREFVIPVGYLGGKVKEYFIANYETVEHHLDWLVVSSGSVTVTVVNTGVDTLTGGRLLRLKDYLTEPFMMTYGDGLSNINPKFVKEMGEERNKNIVTVVHPPARFGSVKISPDGEVVSFSEKEIDPKSWINGGFMYLKPEILKYITGDDTNFEKDVLPKIVWESGLWSFQYEGIWECVDTLRDLRHVEQLVKSGVLK